MLIYYIGWCDDDRKSSSIFFLNSAIFHKHTVGICFYNCWSGVGSHAHGGCWRSCWGARLEIKSTLSRNENCLTLMWPAKKPSPAPTRAPSTLEFPVKNNGADNICWEHRRSTRVGINMVLVVVYQLNSSVPHPTFLLYFDWEFWVEFPEYNEWCERFFLFVL